MRIRSILARLARFLAEAGLDALYPPRCLACLEPAWGGALVCRSCVERFPGPVPRCVRCARQVGTGGGRDLRQGCPACVGPLAARDALARSGPADRLGPLDRVVAAFAYADTPRQLVLALKFGGRLDAAALLGESIAEVLRDQGVPGDLLVPVPLSRKRLRQRGYNQAAVLARDLSSRLDVPLDTRALGRRRHTVPQTTMSLRGRLHGPRGAFVAQRRRVGGRIVMLTDDVLTSGATVRACALALRRAGAAGVVAVVACRAE